jgi:general secretion pathway protein D
MTQRLFRLWLLAAFAGSFFSVAAQTPTPPPVAPSPISPAAQPAPVVAGPATTEEMVLPLKLRDAPLELILDLLEAWTGRTILRPQALPTPTFTLTTKEPLSKGEALRALETLLNLNQIGLVRMGDKFLKVVPLQNVRLESPQIIEGSSLDLPPSGQIVTKLFQFQFLRVNEFLPQVAALLNQNVSQPVIFEKNNAALLTDSITTIQRVELLVEKLDQPLVSNLTPKFYNIHFAKASDVVNKLRTMLQGQIQNQLGTATSYSADDRTNQVILIADPRQLVFFDELVAKLDVKSDPNTRTEVLYLKHAASKDVATLLSSLVSGQTKATQNSGSIQPGQIVQPQPGAQPPAATVPTAVTAALGDLGSSQFSSLITVIADDRSNAVVVNGTVDDLRLIKDLVDKIDIVLAQVRIEVVIAEVTLSDNASTGISALGLDVAGNKLMGFSGSTPGMTVGPNGSSPYFYGTSVDSPAHGGYYILDKSVAATAGHFSLVGLVSLSTTPRKSNSTIISQPIITTTHNKEAKLFFGETRPVISNIVESNNSTTGSNTNPLSTSSQVTQQEIGTTLTVKPLIGNDGSVQLDIKQDISDVADTVAVGGNTQYVIGKRTTNSFITVKSGEIIVLGGMQKENKSHNTSRLGPIPWIGDLLGSRSRTKTRTELVVFIRPTVLTNTSTDNETALKKIDAMPEPGEIRKLLDPTYVPPKTPFYKKHVDIP